MSNLNLYFLDGDEEILVKEGVGPGADDILADSLEDLKERLPEFNSYDQRCWWDNAQRFWIDFGHHTKFYIAHEEKADLKHCGEDYCEL